MVSRREGCILDRAIREALLRAGAPLETQPGDPRLRLRMRVCAATLAGAWTHGSPARTLGPVRHQMVSRRTCRSSRSASTGSSRRSDSGDASFDYDLRDFSVHAPPGRRSSWPGATNCAGCCGPGGHLLAYAPRGRALREAETRGAGRCLRGGRVRRALAEGCWVEYLLDIPSPGFVRDRLADGWEFVEHVPGGAGGGLRRRTCPLAQATALKAAVALGASNFPVPDARRSKRPTSSRDLAVERKNSSCPRLVWIS